MFGDQVAAEVASVAFDRHAPSRICDQTKVNTGNKEAQLTRKEKSDHAKLSAVWRWQRSGRSQTILHARASNSVVQAGSTHIPHSCEKDKNKFQQKTPWQVESFLK